MSGVNALDEVIADARIREDNAFDAPARTTAHSTREFCTSVWKAANLLRHYGVREGARVAVVVGPREPDADADPGYLGETPEPLFAALGAMQLGGVVDFDPPASVTADALVAPQAWVDRYEAAPGCARLAYGRPPDDPAVEHFERGRWSENPVEPPESVSRETVAIDDCRTATHGDLFDAAAAIVADHDVADARVAVRGRFDADVLVAGVIAPLLAGGTVVGGPDGEADLVVDEGGDVRT